jgi:diguanylate cyclase (GGDEF)-like protein/PAS domain S-box-containing protein
MIEKINHAMRTALPGLLLFILPASPAHASPLYRPSSHSGRASASEIEAFGAGAAILFALLLDIERRAKKRIRDRGEVISRAYPLDATLFDREGRCVEILSVSTMPFETGSLINEMLPLDASEKLGKALNAVFEQTKSDPVEFSIKNAWYEASFVPMEGIALCFITDISRWHDEASEKEKLPSLLRSIGNGIIATDENGLVTYLNPMAEKLTGWQNGNSTGIPLPDVFRILVEASREIAENPALEAMRQNGIVSPRKTLLLVARDGSEICIDEIYSPILDTERPIAGAVIAFHDIGDSRHLIWQAGHDALTGLLNRVLLHDSLIHSMASVKREEKLLALLFIDLDGFKSVNDQLGHAAGDLLLKEVAQRLINAVRAEDTVARLGGDEFVVLQEASDRAEIRSCLERIMGTINTPFLIEGMPVSVSTSIGVALYPEKDSEPETLLRQADMAMYHAKQSGRDQYRFFESKMNAMARTNIERQSRLASALKNGEFRLFYQPKINLRNGMIMGLEALIRWMNPDLGTPVLPPDFLPAIQDTQLIVEIGSWVINHVLDQMCEWQRAGISIDVSINIAGRQLHDPDFVDMLKTALDAHPDVEPSRIELEILEEAAITDFDFTHKVISACRQRGVRFSIDDFGTGHSSLSYLKNLPVDRQKIDRSFISSMLDSNDNLAFIQGIVSLSKIFNREVIAEGLESIEQGRMLIKMGCSFGQGYGIAKPMPGEAFQNWMERWNRDPQWLH